MPYPLTDGGAYSIHNCALSLLSQPNTTIKMLAMNTTKDLVNPKSLDQHFVKQTNFECVEVDTRIKPIRMFINLFKSESYFIERFYSANYRDKIIQELKNNSYDIVQLEHLYLCRYLKEIRLIFKGKIVLRSQNIEFKLWETYIQNSKNPFTKWYLGIATKRLKKFETTIVQGLDGVIALTENDKEIYKGFAPQVEITVIPIGFNRAALNNYDYNNQFKKNPIIYHIGSMDWRPNIQGALWFFHKVLPILNQRQPNLEIRFAGKKMPKAIYKFQKANVKIDGEVADAIKYQEDKSILIVPLLSGSGIRVKIIEALALGKSIVSTSLGAQGIKCTTEENILIADDEKSFAEAILKCVNSVELRKKLSNNAINLSKSEYDLHSVGKQKILFYEKLL